MKTFSFSLRSPSADLFDGQAKTVSFFAEDGALQAYAHHGSFTTTLLFSRVRILTGADEEEVYMVRNGMFFFDNRTNAARMLVLNAEKASETDLKSVAEYLDFLNEQLKSGSDLSDFQVRYLKGEKLAVEHQLKKTSA